MKPLNIIKSAGKREFSRKELLRLGVTARQISKLLSEGQIERIDRGYYRAKFHNDDDISYDHRFREATLLAGQKSAICLLSALEFYNLTDQITDTVWIMVPQEKRCSSKKLTLFRRRMPQWSIGIKRHRGFRITNIERTLIDCLTYPSKVPKMEAIAALKKALRQKKTDLSKVFQMAERLQVEGRLGEIFEVLM
jgi:predicted transcriptional regulator of viral defense system